VWLVVFSVFFLYVAVILYSDGGLLLSGIFRSLNISGGEEVLQILELMILQMKLAIIMRMSQCCHIVLEKIRKYFLLHE